MILKALNKRTSAYGRLLKCIFLKLFPGQKEVEGSEKSGERSGEQKEERGAERRAGSGEGRGKREVVIGAEQSKLQSQ